MRAREVLLPLLMLPVIAPLLLAAVKATTAALGGDPFGELGAWLQLLAGFDIVMLRVLIDETGKPVRVVVAQGTPGGPLVASAIDAILHSKYEPATEDGSPVRAWKTEKFAFK